MPVCQLHCNAHLHCCLHSSREPWLCCCSAASFSSACTTTHHVRSSQQQVSGSNTSGTKQKDCPEAGARALPALSARSYQHQQSSRSHCTYAYSHLRQRPHQQCPCHLTPPCTTTTGHTAPSASCTAQPTLASAPTYCCHTTTIAQQLRTPQ